MLQTPTDGQITAFILRILRERGRCLMFGYYVLNGFAQELDYVGHKIVVALERHFSQTANFRNIQ